MKYLNRSFTMPTTNKDMSKLEYDLRVGNITQSEYEILSVQHEHGEKTDTTVVAE